MVILYFPHCSYSFSWQKYSIGFYNFTSKNITQQLLEIVFHAQPSSLPNPFTRIRIKSIDRILIIDIS